MNLFGSVLCSRAVLPHFRANGYGKIIQLSGGGATSPLPRLSAYAASKAAVVRFAETLAEELRGTGIDVNAIAPGALNTRLLDEVLEAGPGARRRRRSTSARSSSGRAAARRSTSRLASPSSSPPAESDGITGQADQRALGSVGGAALARRRSPRVGRLHAAPHRPGRPRPRPGADRLQAQRAHRQPDDEVDPDRRDPEGEVARVRDAKPLLELALDLPGQVDVLVSDEPVVVATELSLEQPLRGERAAPGSRRALPRTE